MFWPFLLTAVIGPDGEYTPSGARAGKPALEIGKLAEEAEW
jgi:hypothetical protein